MTAAYPPPDATREQVEAWERERSEAHRFAPCAACGRRREDHTPGPTSRRIAIGACSSFVEPTVTIEEVMGALGGTAADLARFRANNRGRP